MSTYALRFDFRNPPIGGVSMADRYAAALDMAEWADERGFQRVILSEHHGMADGFISSPLTMAAAITARTEHLDVQVAAMVSATHNPVRLAEDIAAVDLISKGRISVVLANGYVERELAMFGETLSNRVKRTKDMVAFLRLAWTGEEFEWEGRAFRVTPAPYTPGGPKIVLGGASEPASRRAARLGDDFLPSTPDCWEFYRDESIKIGKPDPGPYFGGDVSFFHVTSDPERDWQRIRPHVLHEATEYGLYGTVAGHPTTPDPDQLRAAGMYSVLTPADLTKRLTDQGERAWLNFHPMMGGIPPQLAWESLELFDREVLPGHPPR
ncbi:LLM class flavin-dependent oxidoreductase [Streptomyces sp. NPDC046821]|uniref:LLM class flavin-dependent oxidoreductase n=1 Tax=Streptomyces sp. NPDC046821 TaxID=3154702 RepID=UPI0034036FD0